MSAKRWTGYGGLIDETWRYTPEQERAIIAALDMQDEAQADQAIAELTDAAQTFRMLLKSERARPKKLKAQTRQQLETLEKKCTQLMLLLGGLHETTVEEMERAAQRGYCRDEYVTFDLGPELATERAYLQEGHGEYVTVGRRLFETREQVKLLRKMATLAWRQYEPRVTPGRPLRVTLQAGCLVSGKDTASRGRARRMTRNFSDDPADRLSGRFIQFGRVCVSPVHGAGNLDHYLTEAFAQRDRTPLQEE